MALFTRVLFFSLFGVNLFFTSARSEEGPPASREELDLLKKQHEEKIDSLEFHGYLRSGYGLNGKGGRQVYFKAPGAGAKYRLGNETETYGEVALVNNFLTNGDEPFFKVQIRCSLWSPSNMNDNPDRWDFKWSLRESFVQAGRIPELGSLTFWAGNRFYRRHDIHICDFYFSDMSGYGGGFEEFPVLGEVKLAMAYFGGSIDDYEFPEVGRIAKNTLDIRLYDIPVPFGNGTVWIAPSTLKGGTYATEDPDGNKTEHDYPSASGVAAGFFHNRPFKDGGYNEVSVQYGFGTGSDFSPNVQYPTADLPDTWQFRVTESIVTNPREDFCLMGDAIYQLQDDGSGHDSKLRWFSAGIRPICCFTDHIALAFEAGLDYTDSRPDDRSGFLGKLTVAPEIRFDNKFMSRPVLRLYCTYAAWSDAFKGLVGGLDAKDPFGDYTFQNNPYQDDTRGIAFGVQGEAWW